MAETLPGHLQMVELIETALVKFKKIGLSNLTELKIQSRLRSLENTWERVQNGQVHLLNTTPLAEQRSLPYFKDARFLQCEESYNEARDYMEECLADLQKKVSPLQTDASGAPSASQASGVNVNHLPKIPLPPFDGDVREWESFRDQFRAIIVNNPKVETVFQMHYLVSCLKGPARACLRHIPVVSENFAVAWEILMNRYEDKRMLVTNHVNQLFEMPVLTQESGPELRAMSETADVILAALTRLSRTPEQQRDDFIICWLSRRFDPVTTREWQERLSDTTEPPSYGDFKKFLESRARALNGLPSASTLDRKKDRAASARKVTSSAATVRTPHRCPLCSAAHSVTSCQQYRAKKPIERRAIVKQHNLCFNCLSPRHAAAVCPSKFTCRQCQNKHHTTLHTDGSSPASAFESITMSNPGSPDSNQNIVSSLFVATRSKRPRVLLATAWVTVSVASERPVEVRALLDPGSEVSFISERLAQALRVRRLRMPISVSAVGCLDAGTHRFAARITMSPRQAPGPSRETTAVIMKSLTAYAPRRAPTSDALSNFADLPWADPDPFGAETIDLLIGADVFGAVLLDGLRRGSAGGLIAQNSIFGWILSGPLSEPPVNAPPLAFVAPANTPAPVHAFHICLCENLNRDIRRFWEAEEVPRATPLSLEDKQCEAHFCATHSRCPDGRYMVRLPFKTGPPTDLGHSRRSAEALVHRLTLRLRKNPTLAEEYSQFLHEYERLGHMREVPEASTTGPIPVYIPHHPVLRESSATTRVRVVFNASSPTPGGSSLNDHLLAGPKLQADLPTIVLAWRRFRYVYTADITKMYRQIRLDPRDTHYQRILWQRLPADRPREYELLTVTYGTASAPYQAQRVLQQLAEDEGGNFPHGVQILRDHCYVDDVLFGCDDLGGAREKRRQLVALLGRGGFELRKWASNAAELLTDVDDENHGLACSRALKVDESIKVLGVVWHPASDHFGFSLSLPPTCPHSKRAVLSTIARLFDPLGWVTPATTAVKVLMQRLWLLKLGWDEKLPAAIASAWNSTFDRFADLGRIRLPRWYGLGPDAIRCELHGFADASTLAYAAVVYARITTRSGEVTVSLIAGRAKVAPIKTVTVPRLELTAAVLLARLLVFVRTSIQVPDDAVQCWTDSMVVLAWLDHNPGRWRTYVANRVSEIQSALPNVSWRHVPTAENPADCASRGLRGDELVNHALWWTGPGWLTLAEDRWPRPVPGISVEPTGEERAASCLVACQRESDGFAGRFSSWPRLIRVTAYVFRIITRGKGRERGRSSLPTSLALSANECRAARLFWIKAIQKDLFVNEIAALSAARTVSRKSCLRGLDPFLDEDGILRVGGRLRNAPIPAAQRHPIILGSHPVVKLIVRQAHLRALHAGTQLTLITLRREFWILRGRALVRSAIHGCVICERERAAVPQQLMGDLPALRVSPPARSFIHCGVDYAGPVLVRAGGGRGIRAHKAYIALFICLATRAIHLELVSDYSTSAFLGAFTRFCARRGLPHSVYSDNGTNFVKANKELAAAYRAALRDPSFLNSTASDGVAWHFIPPSAPHFGGLWEAGVRSVKHHLRRVLRASTLTYEEFNTLLCRIESNLNSRPLAPLTDAVDQLEVLTPGHFLTGEATTAAPEPSLLHLNANRLSRWQTVRQASERFWRLWQSDYLNTLQQRGKWKTRKEAIKVGQIVLLRNNTLPPCKWELGRVTQCHPGSDGLTRVVTVKTATSEYKRPLVKLCLLPLDLEAESSQATTTSTRLTHPSDTSLTATIN